MQRRCIFQCKQQLRGALQKIYPYACLAWTNLQTLKQKQTRANTIIERLYGLKTFLCFDTIALFRSVRENTRQIQNKEMFSVHRVVLALS